MFDCLSVVWDYVIFTLIVVLIFWIGVFIGEQRYKRKMRRRK